MTAEEWDERRRQYLARYRVAEQEAALANAEVVKANVDIDGHGCWNWLGNRCGDYGSLSYGGMTIPSHRVAYLALVGEIPQGWVIDHLCENKLCCNPDHLEPVTNRENVRRYHEVRRARAAAFAS